VSSPSNGKAWGGVGPNFTIAANATASYQLADAFSVAGNTFNLTLGTLDLNGKTLGCGNCSISGSAVRRLDFNAGTIACTNWNLSVTTNLTFNMATGTITSGNGGQFDGGGLTYNIVTITAAQSHRLTGANTFASLTLTTTAVKTASTPLGANQVVTGTLTIAGNSVTNRAFITSDIVGTQRTITAAIVSITNADFQDIVGAGAGVWAGTSVGDALGNSGITFTPSATQFAKSGASFLWSDATKWFLATNGGGGAGRVPLPQDDVVFDASSITAGAVTITMDMPRAARSIDFSGITNSPTLTSGASLNVNVFGSWTMGAGLGTWNNGASSTLVMAARSPGPSRAQAKAA
jgi:hypothetical protein